MISARWKKSLSFISLNLTQFFTALNDNFFKLLLIFFLISYLGQEHSNTILSLAGAIFVVPFILFASIAGILADRFSKRTIIYFTRLLEILTTSLGVLAFTFKSIVGGYAVLFLLATHSSIFSPCKYGIIPEIVKKERISHYNGILTATSYLAIILGTFFASFITEATNKNFILSSSLCVMIAVIGGICSLGIEKTKAQSPHKNLSFHFISDILKALKKAHQRRYLQTTIIFGAYFLFMGAYTQLNIIPFTLQALQLSEVQGGYLFLMTAIGIGIGSFSAGQLSGKNVELGFIPLAAFGIMICFLGLYFFSTNFYIVIFLLILIGMFGGFFAVPVDAYIQFASPKEDRGQNLATANFLSFIGVIIASFLIGFLGNILNLSAAQGFLVMGCVTLLLAILLLFLYADPVLRLLISLFAKMFWDLKVIGSVKIRPSIPLLFVVPRHSWLDTLIIMVLLPRSVRYLVPSNAIPKTTFLKRMLHFIHMDIHHFSMSGPSLIKEIDQDLRKGNVICLMQPIDAHSKEIKEWETQLKNLLQEMQVSVIPVHITRKLENEKIGPWNQFKTLIHQPIRVEYGTKIKHSH